MKTNKHQTLLFVKDRITVRANDIVDRFGYSSGTARSYLSYLSRHGLLERTVRGYTLTDKGNDRLSYFESSGCSSFDCPLCLRKNTNHFTCSLCGYELSKDKARILPEKNTLFFIRHAGVYCPICQKLILTEKQAQWAGIREEKA